MKKLNLLMIGLMVWGFFAACSSPPVGETSGTGANGGQSATSSGVGGHGGSMTASLDAPTCGVSQVLGPLVPGDLPEGFDDQGALTARCYALPFYPARLLSMRYTVVDMAPCGRVDHDAVAFLAPSPLPATQITPFVLDVPVDAGSLTWNNNTAQVQVAFPDDAPVVADGLVCIGARLAYVSTSERLCIKACTAPTVENPDPDVYSSYNPDATACGDVGCPLDELRESPPGYTFGAKFTLSFGLDIAGL